MVRDDWLSSDPFEIVELPDDAAWAELEQRWSGFADPLTRCLEVARLGGARCAVIEFGYIDRDYRSEFSAYFSKVFESFPDSTLRVHFFKTELSIPMVTDLPEEPGYIGYMIVRPSAMGRVGRTFLAPPPDLAEAVQARVRDRVSFFGQDLWVVGVPFVQQDTQLGRCAHAAVWVCHYASYRRGETARRATGDLNALADASLSLGRPVPSKGLTVNQVSELFRILDLPPIYYDVNDLPDSETNWQLRQARPTRPGLLTVSPENRHGGKWDTRIFPTCCRYLNSGLPVLIGTQDHAFVLCGYRRVSDGAGGTKIVFIRHDDQRGPYLEVDNPLDDVGYTVWSAVVAPLPDKLWLTPEAAEAVGAEQLRGLAAVAVRAGVGESQVIEDLIARNALAIRTYAIESREYRSHIAGRGLAPSLVTGYRLSRFSRYVWVVEAVDRERRDRGEPCVLGEAIFDGTSSEYSPISLVVHVPGAVRARQLDKTYSNYLVPDETAPYQTSGRGNP